MYMSGLVGVIAVGAGIAILYVDVPNDVVHLDVRQPNVLLKILSVLLILGGLFSLIGNIYFGFQQWEENRELSRSAQPAAPAPAPATTTPPPPAPQTAPQQPAPPVPATPQGGP
jgi:hypothetical protein